MEVGDSKRQITIHGLISHYGTARAKLCANYLHRYLPGLYAKPKVHVYFDEDWIDFVNGIRDKLGDVHRRLWYLKYPVIIFFNEKYVGDHRTIVQYITSEHGIVPDLPLPDLFPDFTSFIPKRRNKDYVYLDIRVGDKDDYVVGKLVFELHIDVVPETCKFFKYLCEPFGEYQFSEPERKWKFSYLGSNIRRICGNAFIQGGSIPEATLLRVRDENFKLKHTRRGIISIANQGGNRSTTEFVISLKQNPFMDGTNVAFGQLIFGEPILAAIEKIPTYYQSPLKDIVIVGCGVIPSPDLWDTVDFENEILKEKRQIITEVQELKNKKEQLINFRKKFNDYLNEKDREKSTEFIFTDEKISDSEGLNKQTWMDLWLRETCQNYEEEEEFSEEIFEPLNPFEIDEEEFEVEQELRSDIEEEFQLFEESLGTHIFTDFTIEKMLTKRRKKDIAQKKKIMHSIVCSVLDNMFEDNKLPKLEDIPVKSIPDVLDERDVASELNQERFEAGLYSLPKCLRKTLVKVFDKLTPSQLKLLGLETREMLREGGISEEELNIYGSEDVMSGVLLAVAQSEIIKQGFFQSLQDHSSGSIKSVSSNEYLKELVEEIVQDAIVAIKKRGPDLIENILVSKESEPSIIATEA